jgi:hypothetical protein
LSSLIFLHELNKTAIAANITIIILPVFIIMQFAYTRG